MILDDATEKQKNIILSAADIIKNKKTCIIRARPGTGKTTTLRKIALYYPDKIFMYLSFARENVAEAKRTMPSNCVSYNVHSLALLHTPNKQVGVVQGYSTTDIARITKSQMAFAAKARKLMEDFFSSKHLTVDVYIAKTNKPYPQKIIDIAVSMISKMIKREIEISHGYYLKEFSYRLSRGLKLPDIDCLFVDEYQDTSGVISSIYQYIDAPKIYVGDSDQAIFGFMGNVDSSFGIDFDEEYELDENFRSVPEVIGVANDVLENILGRSYAITATKKEIGFAGKNAIICRTNSSIIEYIDIYEKFTLSKSPDQIFDLPIAMRKWIDGETIEKKYWYLRKLKTEKELREYVKETHDRGTMAAYMIAKKYSLKKLNALYAKAYSNNHETALTSIITGHASKGLEFDKVRITPDFPNLYHLACMVRSGKSDMRELEEEIKLYFVSITRAKKTIIDSSDNGELTKNEKFYIRNTLKLR